MEGGEEVFGFCGVNGLGGGLDGFVVRGLTVGGGIVEALGDFDVGLGNSGVGGALGFGVGEFFSVGLDGV